MSAYSSAQTWCIEVEWTHLDRVQSLLPNSVILQKSSSKHSNQLLLTATNTLQHASFTLLSKYITRNFFVPYSCSSIDWILYHDAFRTLCQSSLHDTCVSRNQSIDTTHNILRFKISASPKELEQCIQNTLIDSVHTCLTSEHFHPTQYTHVIQCVYAYEYALFRWGICTRQVYDSTILIPTLPVKEEAVEVPISRAYFKMAEVVTRYVNRNEQTNESLNKSLVAGIDIGASPGGWSQVLSHLCSEVLAIDPGVLHIDLASTYSNVSHIPYTAQSTQTRVALLNLRIPVRYLVCDMNIDCRDAAKIIRDFFFPFIHIPPQGTVLVLTLKLVKHPKQAYIDRCLTAVMSVLQSAELVRCIEVRVEHLTANSRNERTLLARIVSR